MLWKTVIEKWKQGKALKYPQKIDEPFVWRTNKYRDDNEAYYDEFLEYPQLPNKQNLLPFSKIMETAEGNKYVRVFDNLPGDTRLVVPVPKRGKNYATLKHFIDQASKTQQKEFWKAVGNEVENLGPGVFVSVHGMGVPYLHVRIGRIPKYYGNSKMKTA